MDKILATMTLFLAVAFSMLSWATYSLWLEYRSYQSFAQTELTVLDARIMEVQLQLIQLKNTCNALMPVHPDSGNDYSN